MVGDEDESPPAATCCWPASINKPSAPGWFWFWRRLWLWYPKPGAAAGSAGDSCNSSALGSVCWTVSASGFGFIYSRSWIVLRENMGLLWVNLEPFGDDGHDQGQRAPFARAASAISALQSWVRRWRLGLVASGRTFISRPKLIKASH